LPNERDETLKKAEKLLRQGKLDLAIAEYVRVIEEQPRDWNTRNALGDLYVRANQADKAAQQYQQIADHLFHEGFYPKAAAIYKKILKIKPDDEAIQLALGEISAKQKMFADAKMYFNQVAQKRRARGDRAGADEMIVRLGSLDPADFEARALAARTLAQNGEAIGAAMQYRAMHADLLDKGRVGEATAALKEAVRYNHDDVEGRAELAKAAIDSGNLEDAKLYLDRQIAGDNPTLLMALMEIELRAGNLEPARELLGELVNKDSTLRARIVELAWLLASSSPEAAFVCIDNSVNAELSAGNYMDAAAILQEFVTRVPGQIAALLKLVEICVDGGLEAIMYEAQAHLADAYLEIGQGSEARVIAEDLVAREPWEHAHIERFRRALVMLDVPDPDSVIADRLSGQGPFIATDPFMAPESFGDPTEPLLKPLDEGGAPVQEPPSEAPAVKEPPVNVPPPTPPAPEPPKAPPPPAPPPSSQNLDEVFDDFRTEVSRQAGTQKAAEQLALAKTYLEMGMTDEAITALTQASRIPVHRFESASMLGRLFLKKEEHAKAVEWLERAAEAPAPTANEGRELLYDLGAILETTGETSRALAVFMELQADAGEFRDVAARVERLSRVQTGG
jgi:tetratricopeptide (TPR) repeat protein